MGFLTGILSCGQGRADAPYGVAASGRRGGALRGAPATTCHDVGGRVEIGPADAGHAGNAPSERDRSDSDRIESVIALK
ncbi:hypothetical protein Msi02_37480 [Microbispora siamensis]|uniref:Uncharacterized protein n=1 Tax=Microbispora siamensis TaxID=564413 RepID=A0ABQ4GNC3_9ACTN|nr:hypothetical protein Msi02_37480 [Microbispora siamensis]